MISSCPFVGLLVRPTLHGDLREDLGDQSEYLGDQRGTLGCQREDLSVDREYLKKLCNLKFLCGAKPLASIKRESDGGGEGEAPLMPTCRRKAADNFELLDLICKSSNPLKFSILVISFKRSGRRQPPGRLHPLPDLRLRGRRRKFTCRPTAPY